VRVDLAPMLKEAIVEVCGLDPAELHDDSRLDALGIDSLSVAEVIVDVEMRLDRELPLELLRRLDAVPTIGQLASELERTLAEPASG
jgi:acyl carrier protein